MISPTTAGFVTRRGASRSAGSLTLRRSRIIPWILAALLGVVALGDRAVHALPGAGHASTLGRNEPPDDGGTDAEDGDHDDCAVCRIFAQARRLERAPSVGVASPVGLPLLPTASAPRGVSSASSTATTRGPPLRA